MNKQVMICGVDCHTGDENCNGYCQGKTDTPPDATPAMVLERKRVDAHYSLLNAERAWYEYFALCEVGPERTRAAEIYERIHRATRP